MTRTLAAVVIIAAASVAVADWPVFRGTPEMSGVGTAKLPDKLDVVWEFKTGNAIEGAPAVVDGVVFVASADKHLYAVDLATGKAKWKQKLGGPTKASPAVKDGKVYVGDADGTLFAFNAADGTPLWKATTPGEINSGCNFYKDTVLVGSYDGTLTAFTTAGKKAWEFKIDQPVNGSPAVAGDKTFLAGCDSVLHVIDAATGKEVAAVDINGQAAATAAVAGDFAYVGTMSNQVIGVGLNPAKKLWEFEPTRRAQPFYGSAAVTDKLVICGSRDKKVYALDRVSGREAWSFVTDGAVDGSPVVVGGRVYVGCLSDEGQFYVLDEKTGRKIQELNLDGPVTGSPAVGPDCILIGTEKGTLYRLGAK